MKIMLEVCKILEEVKHHSGLLGFIPADTHNAFVEAALGQEQHVAQDSVEEGRGES